MTREPVSPIPSPNIWNDPQVYELESQAFDRAGVVERAMSAHRSLAGARVLDLGCGSGFHLSRWRELGAAGVLGVEPHPPLLELARDRLAGLTEAARDRIAVLSGSAEDLPLPDRSIDVMHARWAYFFGSGCEPGLAELDRVMAPGGLACVIDNDLTVASTFGRWFTAAYPAYDADATERFFRRHGWQRESLLTGWEFERREDLDAVVRIELPPAAAEHALSDHEGTTVDYAVVLRTRRF